MIGKGFSCNLRKILKEFDPVFNVDQKDFNTLF